MERDTYIKVINSLKQAEETLGSASKVYYKAVEVTTNSNGLFYLDPITDAEILNVLNISEGVYAIVPYGEYSYVAFDASGGTWNRLASTTFIVKVMYAMNVENGGGGE